jgi:hypothetical protein
MLALAALPLRAADDLPKHTPGETPDADSKLMLDDLPDLTMTEPLADASVPVSTVSVDQAKLELERARAKQQRWQKLAKAGVLSQVEAESTAIQVARALVKYQAALAAQATAQVAQLQARRAKGEITAEQLAAAEAAQKSTAQLATDAAAGLQRQLRLSAEANLDRQRRLLAVGATTKSQVKRAEEKLAALSR